MSPYSSKTASSGFSKPPPSRSSAAAAAAAHAASRHGTPASLHGAGASAATKWGDGGGSGSGARDGASAAASRGGAAAASTSGASGGASSLPTGAELLLPPSVSLDALPHDLRARIASVQEKAGFVPKIFLALAHRPAEFRAFFDYHDALMVDDESQLRCVLNECAPGCLSGAER